LSMLRVVDAKSCENYLELWKRLKVVKNT
jgi:hypothetical protein